MSFEALIGAAGNVLGGLIGDRGQRDANRMNLQIARENRAFQERMSSTAYQRATKDLEAAGLNRILALGSPATTPSGAMATMQNPSARTGEGVSRAAHSAMALRKQREEIHLMASQAAQLDSAAANQSAQSSLANRQRELLDDTQREINARINEIQQRTRVSSAQGDIQGAYADFYNAIPTALIALEKLPWVGSALATAGRAFATARGRRRMEDAARRDRQRGTTELRTLWGPDGRQRGIQNIQRFQNK